MSCKNKQVQKFAYSIKEFPFQFPDELVNVMNLISYDIKNLGVMGSFRIKSLIFSGDVDCAEIIKYENQAEALQKIVKKLMEYEKYGSDLIIGDIKCGNNKYKSLLKYIGNIKNGKIIGYNPESIRLTIQYLHIPELSNLPSEKEITLEKWSKLNTFINSFIAIRWKPDEILSGSKMYNNENIDLEMCVFNSTTTKIDIYYNLYGKYTEITNIFFNENQPKEFFVEKIKTSVIMNVYADKILKAVKQSFSIARIINDCKFIEQVEDLLVSPINSLNSCKTDLSVLIDMIKFNFNIYFNRMKVKQHIGTIILKMSSYYLDDIDEDIFNEVHSLVDLYDEDKFINKIENINKYLEKIVNKKTLDFLKSNKIILNKFYP